ncbi:unnamed protein product [Urochloa decumbens]|uniref:Uncharacterized protein n=1 Tax=Urochloa decumbens TaxID=240449 RepID=A0ABC9GEA0_9POAL
MSAHSRSTGRAFSPPAVCAPSPTRSTGDVSMPSPPPSPRPVGHPSRRPEREICVIPRTAEIDMEEARLSSRALVAMVVGTRPLVSPAQLGRFLEEFHVLLPDEFTISRFEPEDFLVEFTTTAAADRVLHASAPPDAPFHLTWKRWRRQSMGNLTPLRFKVLIEIKGIPAHARNMNTAQIVLNSACSNLEEVPPTMAGDNKRSIFMAAWCIHPDLIPVEKLVYIPEPPEQHVPGNLFLRPEEVIHSKKEGLWYRVEVRLWEVQDWNDDSSDDSSEDDDYPGFRHCNRRGPWPKTTRFQDAAGGGASGGAGPGIARGPG